MTQACQGCGQPLPRPSLRKWCSEACRVATFRRTHGHARSGMPTTGRCHRCGRAFSYIVPRHGRRRRYCPNHRREAAMVD